MARNKAPRPNAAQEASHGTEPKGINMADVSLSDQIRIFNWFNYEKTPKDARTIIEKHNPNIDWNEVKPTEISMSYSWMYLMEKNGCILTPEMIKKRADILSLLAAKYPKKRNQAAPKVEEKDLSTYPNKKHLADFNEIEDELWKTFNVNELVDKAKVLISTINKSQSQEIGEAIKPLMSELDEISKDKDLKEAYKTYNSANIRVAKKFYQSILDHIGFASSVKRVVRVRKKKVVPVEKKLKNLKYLKISDTFKLVSTDPEKLIGANIVWLFNTKTRDLTKATSETGFDIKGTTLTNGSSVKVKKIRKPEMLKQIVETTKARMDKEFQSLKVQERDGNYRINQDTIIVKTF